jgi:hypothetical protein
MSQNLPPSNDLLQYLRVIQLTLPATPGEYYDRLTILRVKQRNARGLSAVQRAQLQSQIDRLEYPLLSRSDDIVPAELQEQVQELSRVNGELWLVEDKIRALDVYIFPVLEAKRNDLELFARLARQVYVLNSQRHDAKRRIDEICHRPSEIKQYAHFKESES